jgi:DNA-binding NarL/FixJ family response regulator
MIRVLLVDDHPVVRTGYRRLLEQTGDVEVVAEAGGGDAAYAAFVQLTPDVTVTDLSMAQGGGLDLIRRVRLREPNARLLVFSMHDAPLLVRRALEAGALGYLTKAGSPDALIVAIRALHAGRSYLEPGLDRTLRSGPPRETELLAQLSEREFEVFRLLAQGHTPAECAALLKLSPKTVANYQTAVKEKLGAATSAALAHLAMRHGVIGASGAPAAAPAPARPAAAADRPVPAPDAPVPVR